MAENVQVTDTCKVISPGMIYSYVVNVLCMVFVMYYTGCPRRNVPDFGRVFLMLKYTDITQNSYV